MKRQGGWLFGLLALGLIALSACERPAEEPADTAQPVEVQRTPAHEFTLRTHDGYTFALADARGQVVLLNFWATWCPPCVVEVPELIEVQDEFADDGLLVVGVSQDTGPSAYIDVRDFAEMFGVNYPLVMDSDLSVGRRYGGDMPLPTTFVIDRDGLIVDKRTGLLNRADILDMLDGVL